MKRSFNYKLGRALAIIGIPGGVIAIFFGFLTYANLKSDIENSILQLSYDEKINSLIIPILIFLFCITLEYYYIRIGFFEITKIHELRFWMFAVLSLASIFLFLLYEITKGNFNESLDIILTCYQGFFLIGSIFALYTLFKSERNVSHGS